MHNMAFWEYPWALVLGLGLGLGLAFSISISISISIEQACSGVLHEGGPWTWSPSSPPLFFKVYSSPEEVKGPE